MSSGAVAASDPGGGEPKLIAGADVEMTEAAEEVAAAAADVKVEGKARVASEGDAAAAMDVEQEGGDAAAATLGDPLYATESAGMVTEEGCGTEGAEGVNGGGGGEERAQVGGLQSEAERKPVPAGDVAAPAVAGQVVEAASSGTSEHAEAESNSNKLEENNVDADLGSENKERDNDAAHCDEAAQNNVPADVEGSSKIHEDDGAPMVDQPDDRSEMLPQTGEQVVGSGNSPTSNEVARPGNVDQCARYCLPPLDKVGFQVSDLVWGKVKSHPWWPGEIFDPSDASDLALKHRKKDSHLVAYFGDNTFAWCDESQLKPFVTNYSQMEKQSSSDAFVGSVNNALEELSRRILSGMSCSCLPEELSDSGMSYAVENAGLKDGVTCSAVNRFEILKCFSPENLLHYVKELALFPGQGGDLLELVIACSQLTSFYRSKGCSELASFQTGDAWVEDGIDTLSTQNVMVEEAVINEIPVINEVHPTHDKPKRGRGRPRKQKPEHDQEVMEKKNASNLNNDSTYHDTVGRQIVMDFDDFESLENKKKRSLESFEDSEKSPTPTVGSSFKIGECIRRAASQLTGSSSIVKAQNEPTVHKNTAEVENGEFDISSDDAVDELTVLNRAKRRRMHRNHTADPKELLSQLCVAATEPMNGYSFSAMIISYFSDYRNYVVSTTTEANVVEKSTSRRGRKRKVLPSPEVETTDHMQDSYWSGLSLHNHPIHNLGKESSTTRPRRRRRSSRQMYVPLSELGASGPKKQIQVIERSIIHVDEKMVDEVKPTALVLSFGRSAAVPSEIDLIKMFSRYGPLKETETEVHKDTNTVKVVFKKRSDAERAFSVAGKYGTFGPSLRSYRLVNMPFYLRTPEANNSGTHPEDRGPEVPGPSESKIPLDAMQIDQVGISGEAEVAGEPSADQVEISRHTSQVEAADKELINQVDMVEKTGATDIHVDQFGICAQAESVTEGSSELVYTQKEASVEGVSEIAQSGAATGASNGVMIGEIQLCEAPNQALNNDTTNTMKMEAASETQTEDTVKHHADATNEESDQVISDSTQTNVVAEAPKPGHISGDNSVFEGVAEVPTTAQLDTEADNENEVSEEGVVSLVLQSQTSNEKPVVQDATEQKVGSESPKQVSGEVPCSSKFEAEALTAESVGQGVVEQVKVQVESETLITDESIADANTEPAVMVEEKLESVEVLVEENVESNTTAGGLLEETVKDQTMAETLDEKIENKAADEAPNAVEASNERAENKASDEAPGGKNREGENAVEASNERTENKASDEAPGRKNREGENAVEASNDQAESKAASEVLSGKTTEGEITVEAPNVTENEAAKAPGAEPIIREKAENESTTEAPDEETRTAEETVEDVQVRDEKTTTGEKTVEDSIVVTPAEKTMEDAMVGTDGKTTEVDKTVEDAKIPDGGPYEAEKTLEDAMVETDGKATGANRTVEDAKIPDGEPSEAEKTVEDPMVETPDGKTSEVEKAVEDATVEAPGEKPAAEKGVEDTMVEAPGVQAGASDQTG